MAPATSGFTLAAIRASRSGAAQPVPEHKARQHDRPRCSDTWSRPSTIKRREHAGARAGAPGRALERPRQHPQRQRQEHQAFDLADVLDARRGRAAERKRQRRDQRAADVPAAVAKKQDDAGAAGIEQREHQDVGEPRAWVRDEQRRDEMEGGEDQRLRIGDLRPAGENVRRPERRLAGRERAGEEGELRIELRGGVVGNFDRARQPGPGQRQEGDGVEAERRRERKALPLLETSRHFPDPDRPHRPAHLYNENGRLAPPASINRTARDHTGCQVPSGLRQAVPRAVCGLPSI